MSATRGTECQNAFLGLSAEAVKELLSSDTFYIYDDERHIFGALKRWVEKHPDAEKEPLLFSLRLGLIPKNLIVEEIAPSRLINVESFLAAKYPKTKAPRYVKQLGKNMIDEGKEPMVTHDGGRLTAIYMLKATSLINRINNCHSFIPDGRGNLHQPTWIASLTVSIDGLVLEAVPVNGIFEPRVVRFVMITAKRLLPKRKGLYSDFPFCYLT